MCKKKLISNYERSLLAEIEERDRKIRTLSVVSIITVIILTIRIVTLGGM